MFLKSQHNVILKCLDRVPCRDLDNLQAYCSHKTHIYTYVILQMLLTEWVTFKWSSHRRATRSTTGRVQDSELQSAEFGPVLYLGPGWGPARTLKIWANFSAKPSWRNQDELFLGPNSHMGSDWVHPLDWGHLVRQFLGGKLFPLLSLRSSSNTTLA